MSTARRVDLQNALDQYWALEPEACNWAVSKIAIACGVPCQTLNNCIQNKHHPATKSQYAKQFLTKAEEEVLTDWVLYCSDTAHPLSLGPH